MTESTKSPLQEAIAAVAAAKQQQEAATNDATQAQDTGNGADAIAVELTGHPQFIMVVSDNPNDKTKVEVEGMTTPAEFNPNSPSHVLAWFLKNNIYQVMAVARQEFAMSQRLNAPASDAPPPSIVVPGNTAQN